MNKLEHAPSCGALDGSRGSCTCCLSWRQKIQELQMEKANNVHGVLNIQLQEEIKELKDENLYLKSQMKRKIVKTTSLPVFAALTDEEKAVWNKKI